MNVRSVLWLAACASLSLGSPPAAAQSSGNPLSPVFVTGTRTPQEATSLVTDVDAVDATRLRDAGPGSLADVLRLQSGVQVTASGGPGAQTSVFLRGANSTQTLFLVEGFRLSSSTLGGTTVEGLPASAFSRVEILRGPASGLYGADAIGGVVQLFLPRGQGPWRPSAEVGFGSYGTWSTRAAIAGGDDRLDLAIGVGHAQSTGFGAVRAPGIFGNFNPDRDGFRRENATLQANLRLAPGHEVGLVALQDRLRSDFDSGLTVDARSRLVSQLVGLRSAHRLGADVTLRLRAGESMDDSVVVSTFPGAFRTQLRQYGVEGEWRAAPGVVLTAGAERLEESVSSTSFAVGTPSERTTDSVRLALNVDRAAHLLQASVRVDRLSAHGDETTGGIAYGYRFAPGWRAGVSWATGFKAPSFSDLYFPNFGRPVIRPETSRSREAGLYYDAGETRAKAVVFRNDVRDLIAFVFPCPDPNPAFAFGCADNVQRAQIQGVSLAWSSRVGATRVAATVDLLDPDNLTTGRQLARRATQTASLRVDHPVGNARVGLEWLLVGERFDDAGNTRRLGGFGVLNLLAEAPVAAGWSVFARVNNAFDKRYETAQFFVQPGLSAFVGIRYRP